MERRYLLRRTPHAESIYFRLNDALRADKDVLEAWAPLVYVVVSALTKMPPAGLGSTRRLHRQPAPTPRPRSPEGGGGRSEINRQCPFKIK